MTFSVEDVETALQIAAASHLKNLSVRIAAPDEASLLLHASWGSYNYALAITPASQVFLRSE
jgi:hypothetical protein